MPRSSSLTGPSSPPTRTHCWRSTRRSSVVAVPRHSAARGPPLRRAPRGGGRRPAGAASPGDDGADGVTEGRGRRRHVLTSPGLGEAVTNSLLLPLAVTAARRTGRGRARADPAPPDLPGRGCWRVGRAAAGAWCRTSCSPTAGCGPTAGPGFTDDLLGWLGRDPGSGRRHRGWRRSTPCRWPIPHRRRGPGRPRRARAQEWAARASGCRRRSRCCARSRCRCCAPPSRPRRARRLVLTLGTFAIRWSWAPRRVRHRHHPHLREPGSEQRPRRLRRGDPARAAAGLVAVAVVAPADLLLGPRLRVTRTATTRSGAVRRAGSGWLGRGGGRRLPAAGRGPPAVGPGGDRADHGGRAATGPGELDPAHFESVTHRSQRRGARPQPGPRAPRRLPPARARGLRGRPRTLPLRPGHGDAW